MRACGLRSRRATTVLSEELGACEVFTRQSSRPEVHGEMSAKGKRAIPPAMQRQLLEDSMRQEFDQTLPDRITRYLQVKPHEVIPYQHFSPASAECSLLFRDGHFYACIALIQAVAEALVRFLCPAHSWKPGKAFEKNVERLAVRGFISADLKEALMRIWEARDTYHHLNPDIELDRQKLEQLVLEKAGLLERKPAGDAVVEDHPY